MLPPDIQGNTNSLESQQSSLSDGLVPYHITDRSSARAPSLTVYANMVKVRIPSEQQIGGGPRGQIQEFTKASRKRFLESMAQARDIGAGDFCSLTYPASYPTDAKTWHTHLANLLKRLARWEPGAHGWWRLEFQKRGAPHFHLLLFGCRHNVKNIRRWLKVSWFQVVGSGDMKHLAAGTQADLIVNRRHAMAYASKYVAKVTVSSVDDTIHATGRLWGTFGHVDRSPGLVVALARWQLLDVKRCLVRWLHSRKSAYEKRLARATVTKGWSVFGAGDESQDVWQSINQSTIYRAIAPFLSG